MGGSLQELLHDPRVRRRRLGRRFPEPCRAAACVALDGAVVAGGELLIAVGESWLRDSALLASTNNSFDATG